MTAGSTGAEVLNFRFYYDIRITKITIDTLTTPLTTTNTMSVTNQDP